MSNNPAFLFYPGDYFKDTQIMKTKTQVAYDRIMCEHIRKISVNPSQNKVEKNTVLFLMKNLRKDEQNQLFAVLNKIGDDYQIKWVAVSIANRRRYTLSRQKNATKKK